MNTGNCWVLKESILYSRLALGYNETTPGIHTFCHTHQAARLLEGRMIGRTISHYKILEKLGEGGMGVVYKAQDTKLGRVVAIKLLRSEITGNPENRRRFEVEARAAAALNHPNVTTVYSIEEIDDLVFIVMEFVDGQELKHMLRSGPMDLKDVADIAAQLADGLHAAHEHGVVHRDMKSSNVLVTDSGCVKIMDFGVAKLAGASQLTRPGTTIGTIAYMSPEQIQATEVDRQTDLWSFGVLLYEMITGTLPFKGEFEAAIIYEILNREPEALQTFRSDIPSHLVSLVSQMLQKDPRKRIASAKEVIDRLQRRPIELLAKDKEQSIAVLYFENMSSEKENEYFCAGMTEDLIVDLSKIHGIRVIPRSDVLPFRNKEVNSRQVGETLGVDYILEGSVRKAGSKMRITAQMIDVKSGFQIWAERYDRLIEDIFDVQIEVSEKIAAALKVSLTDTEKRSIAKKPTDDVRAYDFYLRGGELLLRRWQADRHAAIQMFEHALSIDPGFSLAYVGLAEAYSYNYMFFGGDRKWLENMMEMNEKALSLDPDLIEAKFGIGMAYFHQKRFVRAKKEFQKVIDSKSDFYPAFYWLIWTLILLAEYDVAITYARHAAVLKGYSEEPWHLMEQCFRKTGKLKLADDAGQKVVDLAARKLELNPKDVMALSRVAIAHANKGNRAKAMEAIERIVEIDPDDGMALYNCADAFGVLGMKDKALEFLASSFTKGTTQLMEWVTGDPYLDSVRGLSEFREIVARHCV